MEPVAIDLTKVATTGVKTFKKYSNRKIYSSEKKFYVSLRDLVQEVRNGVNIVVLEHGTGNDVTNKVLAEAIASCGDTINVDKLHDVLRG